MKRTFAVLLILLCAMTATGDSSKLQEITTLRSCSEVSAAELLQQAIKPAQEKSEGRATTGILTTDPGSEFVIGIFIQIDDLFIERTRAMKTKEYRDVVIRFNGKEVTMTYEDFLNRLGLMEKKSEAGSMTAE